jgi:hypothetical protein
MALGVLSVASACFILLVRPYDLIFKLVSAHSVPLVTQNGTLQFLTMKSGDIGVRAFRDIMPNNCKRFRRTCPIFTVTLLP